MLGVAIALIGSSLQLDSNLFLGWFGPRSIASIIYGLLIIERSGIQGSELIFSTTVITVLISIFAHGITAYPGSIWYASQIADKKDIHHLHARNEPCGRIARPFTVEVEAFHETSR